jgi:hypothetical protein
MNPLDQNRAATAAESQDPSNLSDFNDLPGSWAPLDAQLGRDPPAVVFIRLEEMAELPSLRHGTAATVPQSETH